MTKVVDEYDARWDHFVCFVASSVLIVVHVFPLESEVFNHDRNDSQLNTAS